MSGADLEYQRLLKQAGKTTSDKLDAARLNQLSNERITGGTWPESGGGGIPNAVIYTDVNGNPLPPGFSVQIRLNADYTQIADIVIVTE